MRAAVQSAQPDVETSLEVHLRRIIETQPVCLTRIAADGTFLAVNDAALLLLGAERLEQVLETSVLSLVAPEDHGPCKAFLGRISAGDRGSTEVDLTGLGGRRHALQIHAVSLPGASDSLPSTLCTFRDVTEHRTLERALVDAAAREEEQASALATERERLTAALTAHAAGVASSSAADQARLTALEAALAESEQRHKAVAEQHAVRQVQLIADFEAAQQQFESSLTEQLGHIADAEATLREAEAREQAMLAERGRDQETWRRALADAAAEHARQSEALQTSVLALETSLMQTKAQIETLEALREGHAAERADLARATAEAESARAEAAERLSGAAADRLAIEAELRGLSRAARAGRLAAALANDLEAALTTAADRGRRALAALQGDTTSRPHVEALLAGAFEAASMARRIRREAGSRSCAVAGRVVQSLEGSLGALLSPGIALSVLVGSTDTQVDLAPDQLEQLVMTLVANRRATMISGGHASLEVADVDIDEACARERGASPGAHVLLALHVSGPGIDTGLPDSLFGAPADEDGWRAAGPGMAGLHHVAQAAGGHLWATREGSGAIAFEVYLPSVTSSAAAAAPETPR